MEFVMLNAIRVRMRVETDTVRIPELAPMIGKDVEIIVIEEKAAPERHPDVQAFMDASKGIPEDLDFDAMEKAVNDLRENSMI